MTNTPFSKQVEIVADYFMNFLGDDVYDELITTFDLGFPIAAAIVQGGISIDSLNTMSQSWVTEAFLGILEFYGDIDPYGDYSSIEDIMDVVFADAKG